MRGRRFDSARVHVENLKDARVGFVTLLLLCLAGVGGAFMMQSRDLTSQKAGATHDSELLVMEAALPALGGRLPTSPAAELRVRDALGPSAARGEVLRIRIWSPEGELAFSTDFGDTSSTPPPLDAIAAAVGDKVTSAAATEDEAVWSTVVPLRSGRDVFGVAEVDLDLEELRSVANSPWKSIQLAAAAAAALLVLLTAVTFIPRKEKGEAAPVPEKKRVPDNKARADGEPLDLIDPELMRADQAKLAARVQKSEASRKALELQLDQLRRQVMTGDLGVAEEKIREVEEERAAAIDRATAAETRVEELEARVNALGAPAAPQVKPEDLVAAEQRARVAEREASDLAGRLRESETRIQVMETALADAGNQVAKATELASDLESRAERGAASPVEPEPKVAIEAAATDEPEPVAEPEAEAQESETAWLEKVQPIADEHDVDTSLRERLTKQARRKRGQTSLDDRTERAFDPDKE